MLMTFRCFICEKKGINRVFKNFGGLKRHFTCVHCKNGVCPVCGVKVGRIGTHLYLMSGKDFEHAIAYGLYKRVTKSKLKDRYVKLAYAFSEISQTRKEPVDVCNTSKT